jgi:hypothetical protein
MAWGEYVWACTIEKSPPPLLVAYQKNIDTELTRIKAIASQKNLCNGANGTFSTERRFVEFFQGIGASRYLYGGLITDFNYNVMVVAWGNSKGPVVNQGKILENIESGRIVPAIRAVAWACALEQRDEKTGLILGEELSNMIESHRSLVEHYKSVVVGNKTLPDGLSDGSKNLYNEILMNYSPESTATCKWDAWVSNIQDVMTKIAERMQRWAKKTNDTENDWQKAIKLFSGKWAKTQEYADLQRRLLSTELARQWLTQKARDAMLGKLSCVQRETTPSSDPEELGKANSRCREPVLTIAKNITNWYKGTIAKSKTSDEYIKNTLAYDTAKTRLWADMASFWSEMEKIKSDDDGINKKMITDLVNIHAELTITNDLLKKKIPEMYDNCMKGQPDIRCPQP